MPPPRIDTPHLHQRIWLSMSSPAHLQRQKKKTVSRLLSLYKHLCNGVYCPVELSGSRCEPGRDTIIINNPLSHTHVPTRNIPQGRPWHQGIFFIRLSSEHGQRESYRRNNHTRERLSLIVISPSRQICRQLLSMSPTKNPLLFAHYTYLQVWS